MKYKALLLDFDNTLIGTENSNYHIFKESMSSLVGRELTPEDSQNFAGHTWKGIFRVLNEMYLPHMSPEEIRAVFISAKTEYFKRRTAPVARGLCDLLDMDIPTAIVTGSCRAEVEMFAHLVPLDRFDLIVTDELYELGKPAPDAYDYAVKFFGCAPAECLAVEDSTIGLTAAGRCGAVTVFTREFAHDDLSGIADYTVDDMSEIQQILKMSS